MCVSYTSKAPGWGEFPLKQKCKQVVCRRRKEVWQHLYVDTAEY